MPLKHPILVRIQARQQIQIAFLFRRFFGLDLTNYKQYDIITVVHILFIGEKVEKVHWQIHGISWIQRDPGE